VSPQLLASFRSVTSYLTSFFLQCIRALFFLRAYLSVVSWPAEQAGSRTQLSTEQVCKDFEKSFQVCFSRGCRGVVQFLLESGQGTSLGYLGGSKHTV